MIKNIIHNIFDFSDVAGVDSSFFVAFVSAIEEEEGVGECWGAFAYLAKL